MIRRLDNKVWGWSIPALLLMLFLTHETCTQLSRRHTTSGPLFHAGTAACLAAALPAGAVTKSHSILANTGWGAGTCCPFLMPPQAVPSQVLQAGSSSEKPSCAVMRPEVAGVMGESITDAIRAASKAASST